MDVFDIIFDSVTSNKNNSYKTYIKAHTSLTGTICFAHQNYDNTGGGNFGAISYIRPLFAVTYQQEFTNGFGFIVYTTRVLTNNQTVDFNSVTDKVIGSYYIHEYNGVFLFGAMKENDIIKSQVKQIVTGNTVQIVLNETISSVNLTMSDGGNLASIDINGNTYVSFPVTVPVSGDVSITAVGKKTKHSMQLQNTNNMKSVTIGSTVYSNFPTTVQIDTDAIVQMSGEDDKQITVNYTRTKLPTINNT